MIEKKKHGEKVTPQPIKFSDPVPQYVYKVNCREFTEYKVIRFDKQESKLLNGKTISHETIVTDDNGTEFTILLENCYRTPQEAFKVFMKGREK